MATKLSRDTLDQIKRVYNGSISVVKEIKHNHDDCPAGTDTRQRLYTTLTEDKSKILCHCFNCGASGVVHLKSFHTSMFDALVDIAGGDPKTDVGKAWVKWSTAQKKYTEATGLDFECAMVNSNLWPYKGFKSQVDLAEWFNRGCYGMRYHPDGFIMTPRGECGYDIRATGEKRMWRVAHPDHAQDSKLLVYNTQNSDVAVIVEDALSAMKVDMCGFAGVALCSSSLSNEDAFKLSMRFKYFVVWLDNDNSEVLANAKVAEQRLRLYSDNVEVNLVDRDPKIYDRLGIDCDILDRLSRMRLDKKYKD